MAESPEQVLPPPPSPNHRGSCGRLLLDNLNLPPGTSTYRYQGRDYAESAMHGETRLFEQDDTDARSEYVVFTHVPPEEVICVPRRRRQQQQKEEENKSQREEEEEGPDEEPPSTTTLLKSRNFTYLEDGRILIVRMRTLSHERPKFQFDRLLITKLNNMGLGDKIDGRVGAAVQGTTRTKAPDCSYAPRPLPAGRSDKWPSIVVEIGYSESPRKLESDAKWWLEESGGDVQLALAIHIKRRTETIVMQRWERVPSPTQSDPQRPRPRCVQEITISKGAAGQPATVPGAPLNLPFEKVFLRPRRGSDADLTFFDSELRSFADGVWIEGPFLVSSK